MRAQTMENWGRFFHYNNKLERVSQSTTMRITAEKFRRTSKTPDIEKQQQYQRRQKVKITILNTFYCVTECLPLTSSEKDEFPDCRSCSAVSLAVVRSHRFTQFNKNFRGKWLS